MLKVTASELDEMMMADSSEGYCTACNTFQHGVEPDARNYHCEVCGNDMVFGIEELVVLGQVQIVERRERVS